MAEPKTRKTGASVREFLDSIEDPARRKDTKAVVALMRDVTGARPEMWGDTIVGFGRYRYRYESGREGEWFVAGVSPRKQNLTIYVMAGFEGSAELLAKLGRHKTGKSCLYVTKLDDVDRDVLRTLVERSVEEIRRRHPD